MLNLEQLIAVQKSGESLIRELDHEETVILQNYCLAAAQSLIQAGGQAKRSTTDVVLNAFRNGVALGLGVSIKQDKLTKRSIQ